jgi:hypothetical protein
LPARVGRRAAATDPDAIGLRYFRQGFTGCEGRASIPPEMRHSNQSRIRSRLPLWAAGLFSLAIVGCGSAPVASAPPTPAPTPVVTPDPHLREPVTADQIFRALSIAKLGLVANNANSGGGNKDIVKQINADIGSWPLRIIEYRSSAVLAKATSWKPGEPPGGDEAPYAFAGLNVLLQYGPISARKPAAPDAGRQAAAASIVGVLDPLLWPLAQRSVVPIASRTAEPVASVAPSAGPSAKASKAP